MAFDRQHLESAPYSFCEHIVNLPHDSIGPLNRGRDHRFRPRAWLGIKQILSSLQVPSDENPRYNGKHAFAAFVHSDILSLSSFVRLRQPTNICGGPDPGSRLADRGFLNFWQMPLWPAKAQREIPSKELQPASPWMHARRHE